MAPPLPPLTERIDRGAAGGYEFQRLMHQLLFRYADLRKFIYEPRSGAGGDGGIDGLVQGELPRPESLDRLSLKARKRKDESTIKGPVVFQFKWLWKDIHKGSKARQIEESLRRSEGLVDAQYWILVTPWDLTAAERDWLSKLQGNSQFLLQHWGQERIFYLLSLFPALLARYYPYEAKQLIAAYDGFDFGDFNRQYRERVCLAYRNLRTLGLPPETMTERDARNEIKLQDIFILPNLLPEEGKPAPSHLIELLKRGNSVVALGDPGAGKSTMLAFLALLYAGEAKISGFTPRVRKTPLLISLRDFVRLQQVRPDLSFLAYLESRARSDHGLPHAHRAFFESALRMGEAIVLLDGLDEVGGEVARRRMAQAILAFKTEYPACPFWVTSRVYGYTRDVRLSASLFVHARIDRLDNKNIDDFIKKWYLLQWPNNERERKERTSSLRGAVHRTPSVRRLAGNPLLLTLMAFIHQGLRRLPQDRGELYEKCIEMLLKTWQEAKLDEKGGQTPHPLERLKLHIHTQKDYLAHLAFHAQVRNQSELDEEARGLLPRHEVLDCLAARHHERSLRTRPELTKSEAREEMEDFLDYVSDRAGLLIDRGGGLVSFLHLSFQEYLAAWVFTCGAEPPDSVFETYLGDPAWEEVLLLRLYIILRTPGGGGDQAFDAIVSRILRRLEQRESRQGWMTLMRALRDNLDFTTRDQYFILRKAVDFWLERADFEHDWFIVLEEACLFSESARSSLREVIEGAVLDHPPSAAVSCVHLAERLFGTPGDALARIKGRREIKDMLPDIAVFNEALFGLDPGFGAEEVLHAWSVVLRNLDSAEVYCLTFDWAMFGLPGVGSWGPLEAALVVLWEKILIELRSRAIFLDRHFRSGVDLLSHPGAVTAHGVDPLRTVTMPLSGCSSPVRVSALTSELQFHPKPVPPNLLCPKLARDRLLLASSAYIGSSFTSWSARFLEEAGSRLEVDKREMSSSLELVDSLPGVIAKCFSSGRALYFFRYFDSDFSQEFLRYMGRIFGNYFGSTWNTDRVPLEVGFSSSGSCPQVSLKSFHRPASVLRDILMLGGFNLLLAIGRSRAVEYGDGRDEGRIKPEWFCKYPVEVYLVSLAWEEHGR